VIKKVERKKMLPDDLYSRWAKAIPVDVEQKISENRLAPTQKGSDTLQRTTKLDRGNSPLSGIKAGLAKLQHYVNVAAAGKKSEL
jgi:hypothetical protein